MIHVSQFGGTNLSDAKAGGEPHYHQADEGGNHERSGEWRNRLGYGDTGYEEAAARIEAAIGFETSSGSVSYVVALAGSYVLLTAR